MGVVVEESADDKRELPSHKEMKPMECSLGEHSKNARSMSKKLVVEQRYDSACAVEWMSFSVY